MDLEAFKKHLGKGGPEPAAPAPDAEPDDDGDEAGMSPGDQAMKAIKEGDSAALEEAIKRCVGQGY